MTQLTIIPQNRIARIALAVAAILAIPLVFTLLNPNASIYGGPGGGFDWMPGDFVAMGLLLFLTGLAIDYAARTISNPTQKTIAIGAIVLALLVIWVELAVQAVSQLALFILGSL